VPRCRGGGGFGRNCFLALLRRGEVPFERDFLAVVRQNLARQAEDLEGEPHAHVLLEKEKAKAAKAKAK